MLQLRYERFIRYQYKYKKNYNKYKFKQSLDDLKKKLIHQWDFIQVQADAQIKYTLFLNIP